MSLQGKYSYAIQTSKELRMQGGAEERDGKLYIKGTVDTQEQANKIWDAIKTIPTWRNDIQADIKVTGGPSSTASARPAAAGTSRSPARPAGRVRTSRTRTRGCW